MNRWPSSPPPDHILAARKRTGLTQAAAGALVYRSVRRWQEWEYGERGMDPAIWDLWQFRAGLIDAKTLKRGDHNI